MRSILKKLDRQQNLNDEEYTSLMEYIEKLRCVSPESYTLFYDKYALLLYNDYAIYLPRFSQGIDDLINFLILNPQIRSQINRKDLPLSVFPTSLHPYLNHMFNNHLNTKDLWILLEDSKGSDSILNQLPRPRQTDIVYKFEEANPYKEPGLKFHFDRIGRYSFITRLQTYRYLNKKAHKDRIEYIASDKLGGIFTNKQRSIYYYIFLSENNTHKAQNACSLLNVALYGIMDVNSSNFN
jgi:hypothetical protein